MTQSIPPYVQQFVQQSETARISTIDLWKHITLLEATILGLTVGLAQGDSGRPGAWLIVSWVVLLFAIMIGCLLIKTWIDYSFDGGVRSFCLIDDTVNLQERITSGNLAKGSEEHQGLFSSAMRAGGHGELLTPRAKQLADKYPSPSSSYIKLPQRDPVARWLQKRWPIVAGAFYGVSVAAFIALLLSILVPAP